MAPAGERAALGIPVAFEIGPMRWKDNRERRLGISVIL
jgi:hypothetical protein